ncbi:MAG: META domain-containing protein [Taibaiella sp.]
MKKGSLIIAILCLLTAACSSMKKQTETKTEPVAALTGTWVLDIVPYTQGTFDSLYPERKPSLSFDPVQKTFAGNTSCNTINGALVADSKAISFKGDIAMTRMACVGDGESVFMQYLKRINKYAVSADGKELTLIQGDMALMRFHKK